MEESPILWIDDLAILSNVTTENFCHTSLPFLIINVHSGPIPVAWYTVFLFSSFYHLKRTSIFIDATLVIKKSCTSMRLRRFITGLTTRWLFRTYASCWHGTSQVFNEYIILRHHSAYIIYLHGFTKSLDWAYYSTFLYK